MNGVRTVGQVVSSIAWTVVAAVLFTGFLWVSAAWVGHTGQALGLWEAPSVRLAEHVSRTGMGIALLGLSRLYRKLDDRENAGSVLLLVLMGWTMLRLARYRAALDREGEDQGG